MANYVGTFRSNYFGVKDVDAFQQFCEKHNLEFIEKNSQCGFLMSPDTEGGFSTCGWDLHNEEETDILAEIAAHLAADQVAIIIEVGQEKLRYLVGLAWLVNADGEQKFLSLADLALEAAKSLTTAEVSGPEY